MILVLNQTRLWQTQIIMPLQWNTTAHKYKTMILTSFYLFLKQLCNVSSSEIFVIMRTYEHTVCTCMWHKHIFVYVCVCLCAHACPYVCKNGLAGLGPISAKTPYGEEEARQNQVTSLLPVQRPPIPHAPPISPEKWRIYLCRNLTEVL